MDIDTVQLLLTLIVTSGVTALIVEAIKKLTSDKKNFSYNLMALIVALIVSICYDIGYVILNDVVVDNKVIVRAIVVVVFTALSAEVGYDKVKQTILQIKQKTEDQKNEEDDQ